MPLRNSSEKWRDRLIPEVLRAAHLGVRIRASVLSAPLDLPMVRDMDYPPCLPEFGLLPETPTRWAWGALPAQNV